MPDAAPASLLSYVEAIQHGLFQAMEKDPTVITIGEGVPDPKRIFGTTDKLLEHFGPDRVFDMPLSENGVTGICLGAAQAGLRPVLVHQRLDFLLLAMDQIINIAAKWHFLFGDSATMPIVIRAIIGRGWGQGPQHSQSLQALFAHIPGLRVVMPATAYDAKGMLTAAIEDNNPVLMLEHRWLYHTQGYVPDNYYTAPLEGANVIQQGDALTVVACSQMVVEAQRASQWLLEQGVGIELIDMRSMRPLDMTPVITSVKKTGRLLVLDTGWKTAGISAEIIAQVTENAYDSLTAAPIRLCLPDQPTPTAPSLTENFYIEAQDIALSALRLIGWDEAKARKKTAALKRAGNVDVPNADFKGPF